MMRLGVAVVALSVVSGSAQATVMLPLSVERMVEKASMVVRCQVTGRTSAWDESRRRIHTYATIEVLEALRGDVEAKQIFTVRSLGGVVGDIGMTASGTAKLGMGEEMILFLRAEPREDGMLRVVGMSQGAFHLRPQKDGTILAVADTEGIAMARPGADGVLRPGGHEPSRSMLLGELVARVRAVGVDRTDERLPPSPSVPAPTDTKVVPAQ